MGGFREIVCNTVTKVTGMCKKEKHSSKEALVSIRAQVLAGEQKALQNLQESGYAIHVVEDANNYQSIKAQLLATDQNALEALHESIFSVQAPTTARDEKVESLQSVKTCNTEQKQAADTRVRITERKQRDLLREKRQMLAVQKRVNEHRTRRAARVSPGIPLCRIATKPLIEPSYMESLPSHTASQRLAHDKSFYENQTDEESRKYVQDRLMDILGPERMKFELLPSGHNPIDPTIADYNQQSATDHILDQWEDHKTELRRQEEEQKRLAEEEEAERTRIQILLIHYRERYINRLERLAHYGPDLTRGVDLIEAALLTDDFQGAASVIVALAHQVLLPIHALLTECKQEIPLEEVGADKLKGVWPLERLEAVYLCLQDKLDVLPEALDMLQGVEIICAAICNPTPFEDPLAPKQVPTSTSYISLAPKAAESTVSTLPSEDIPVLGATSAPASNGFSKLLQATSEAVNAEQRKDSGPASSGFAKLLAATAEAVSAEQQKEPAPASSSFEKLLAATANKFNGSQEDVSSVSLDVPSINIVPPESTARSAVLQYIATDNMYFESEVQDLIKRDTVVGVHRRNAAGCLKELIGLANGEKGILGDMDAGNYRCQIEKCVTKIDTLKGAARLNKETQALRRLCGSALMLWSVHAR